MSGISLLIALEMFTNPHDLQICIGRAKGSKKYGLLISRGPGHRYKPMISAGGIFESRDDAISEICGILTNVNSRIMQELDKPGSLTSGVIPPKEDWNDDAHVLTPDLIEWIMSELEENMVARTYERVSV